MVTIIFLLTVVLSLVIIMFLVLKKRRVSNFKNNGFANIDSKYTMPQVKQNLVTPEEAEYIITTAKKSFKESQVVSGSNQGVRKSKTTWLYTDDPTIKNIIQRICDLTNNDITHCEPLQVVQYEPGGYYNDHHDACCDDDPKCTDFVQNGGQRILTVLIYLNDEFTGGATHFSKIQKDIKPDKYGAIIFKPLEENSNKCHPLALHRGTPVKTGVKYICNVWIREGRFK
jgi:prolyl 4-hydroxylase